MAKKLIQRNLNLNQRYELINSFYQSFEDGGGCLCENCGRIISNVAIVRGQGDNKEYAVGMDCVETLTGIKNEFEFDAAKNAFTQAKSARASILKYVKLAKNQGLANYRVTARTFTDDKNFYKEPGAGKWHFTPGDGANFRTIGPAWKQYPKAIWGTHIFPMIADLVTP